MKNLTVAISLMLLFIFNSSIAVPNTKIEYKNSKGTTYLSTDDGKTWIKKTSNVGIINKNIEFTNSNGIKFLSTDDGKTWIRKYFKHNLTQSDFSNIKLISQT